MLTPEQLLERKDGIGGSDSAGICAVSKWKTPLEIYMDKITPDVLLMNDEKMDAKRRGSLLEPLVKILFERDFCKSVRVDKRMHRNDKFPHLTANIDGFIQTEKALVEIKTANNFRKKEFGNILSDEIPNDYLAQSQHYLNVFPDYNIVYVPVLFGDDRFLNLLALDVLDFGVIQTLKRLDESNIDLKISLFKVEKNKTFSAILKERDDQFWFDHVKKLNPPPYRSEEDVMLLFPKAQEGKIIEADEETLRLKDLLDEKDRILDEVSEAQKQLKIQLKARIGDAEEVLLPNGGKISWKNIITNKVDSVRLKALMPNVYMQFLKTSQSRRLTF